MLPRPAAAKQNPSRLCIRDTKSPGVAARENSACSGAHRRETSDPPQGLKIPGETEAVIEGHKHRERIVVPDKQPLKVVNLSEKRHVSVPLKPGRSPIPNTLITDRIREKIRTGPIFILTIPSLNQEVYLTLSFGRRSLKDLQIIGAKAGPTIICAAWGCGASRNPTRLPSGDLNYPNYHSTSSFRSQ